MTSWGYEQTNVEFFEVVQVIFLILIEDFCYALLDYENFEFDWVNNEGGYGTVYIYVDKNHIKVEHNARISTTEYSEREY